MFENYLYSFEGKCLTSLYLFPDEKSDYLFAWKSSMTLHTSALTDLLYEPTMCLVLSFCRDKKDKTFIFIELTFW